MMWNDILYVGWQWNHGLMLWWRFHCTGKYSLGFNNQWPSNPSAVLKHQPTDSLWIGSSEVSSLVRISSADYSRLVPCGGVNVAWKRSNFPPDGVSGNRSSGGVKCPLTESGRFHKMWRICVVWGSDSTWLVALSSGYSTHGVLREHKEPGCCWVKWCSSAEYQKEIVTVTSLFQEGTTDCSGKGIPSDDYKPVETGGIVLWK